jgi:hypothetical protein
MSSPNITRDQKDQQRSEWEGFGTSGSFAQKGPEPQAGEGAKKGMGTAVSEAASDLAHQAGNKAESAVGAVACGMQSLAQNIREHVPQAGMVGSTASAVADKLERGGHYIENQGLKGMGQDMTDLIRRNPIPALLAGIGVGFLIAQVTRRRS